MRWLWVWEPISIPARRISPDLRIIDEETFAQPMPPSLSACRLSHFCDLLAHRDVTTQFDELKQCHDCAIDHAGRKVELFFAAPPKKSGWPKHCGATRRSRPTTAVASHR